MPNNDTHHGWAVKRKLNITCVFRWLKTVFSKLFNFKDSYILFAFFSQKLKKNTIFSFLLPLINSDIILQEFKELFSVLMFSKKTVLKKVSEQVSRCL